MVDKYELEMVKNKHGELVYTHEVATEIEHALALCTDAEEFSDVKQVLQRLLRDLS